MGAFDGRLPQATSCPSRRSSEVRHKELLDVVEEEAEQFDRPCPNLATEDTYGDGGEDDVRGRREDGVGEVV